MLAVGGHDAGCPRVMLWRHPHSSITPVFRDRDQFVFDPGAGGILVPLRLVTVARNPLSLEFSAASA